MMTRTRATLTLLASLLFLLACVAAPMPVAPAPVVPGIVDVVTYRAIQSRLRTGEPYYDVIGDELRRGKYATREAFNWRTPLLWSSLARVPEAAGRTLLITFGVLLLAATLAATVHQPLSVTLSSNIMQVGAVIAVVVPGAFLFGEDWAGVLIGLSVCMYGRKQTRWAVPLGLLALFVRELAAPYCVACTIAAAVNRRWREVGVWLGGACLYAVYYGWHLVHVWEHRLPTDLALTSSWLELGGLPFLLQKAHWHAWLFASPPWATALALAAVGLGISAARAPLHVRLASAVYVGFFLAAGKSFNGYWGLVAWPTWALACGFGADVFVEAARVVSRRAA